jgi:hypothetical protein
MLPVIERLLADSVACEKTGLPLLVPDGHCEHAVDPLGQPAAFVFPEVRQHFGVGARLENVAALQKLFAEKAKL